jgi:hypothetical protein
MQAVARMSEGAWIVPGANVMTMSGQNREVDLLGVSGADLIMGEVKPARAFTKRAISSQVRLATALGASMLVLASLDVWTENRLKVAEAAATRADLRLHVFDGQRLLSD